MKAEYRNFMMDDFKDMCWSCGKERYPDVRAHALDGIGVSIGTCPICKKKKVGIIPGRDWAYRANMFEKVI